MELNIEILAHFLAQQNTLNALRELFVHLNRLEAVGEADTTLGRLLFYPYQDVPIGAAQLRVRRRGWCIKNVRVLHHLPTTKGRRKPPFCCWSELFYRIQAKSE